MKNILSTFICFGLLLSTGLTATPMHQGYSSDICTGCMHDYDADIFTYMQYKKIEINQMLSNYELEGSKHNIGFDYHIGYLTGMLSAYKNLDAKFNQP